GPPARRAGPRGRGGPRRDGRRGDRVRVYEPALRAVRRDGRPPGRRSTKPRTPMNTATCTPLSTSPCARDTFATSDHRASRCHHEASATGRPMTMPNTLAFDTATARRTGANPLAGEVGAQPHETRRRLELKPGERVIDTGAGPCLLPEERARAVGPAGRVVGIDLSNEMLSMGRVR